MKILLEIDIDDVTGKIYQRFPYECRQQLISDIKAMVQRTATGVRLSRLKGLLEEMRMESGGEEIDAETLHSLLRTEDY